MQTSLEILVRGKVQGIGYRDFTVRAAKSYQIKGSVRNLPDGRVKVIASGEKSDLDNFLSELKRGPLFSSVKELQSSELIGMEDYEDFIIEY